MTNIIVCNHEYYLYNGHGDVTQLPNFSGIVTKNYDYDSYGVDGKDNWYNNFYNNDTNPWRYCGEYFDYETKTVYLRARNYAPNTGRFTSEDPARAGLNWYTYCNGNPVNRIDPSGLESHYIFYNNIDKDNNSLKDRANKKYKSLLKSGIKEKDIYIKDISTEQQFSTEWNKIDNGSNRVKEVSLYLHSNPNTVIIDASKSQYLRTKQVIRDGKATNSLLISSLSQKDIYEIFLYGCNTAHQDYKNRNVAYTLTENQEQVSRVIGWDGSMRWSRLNGKPILASSQEYFESWLTGDKREPQGQILYQRIYILDDPDFPEYLKKEIISERYK